MKVEVELEDLETILNLADEYVYWKDWSVVVADRLELAVKKAKENNVNGS